MQQQTRLQAELSERAAPRQVFVQSQIQSARELNADDTAVVLIGAQVRSRAEISVL